MNVNRVNRESRDFLLEVGVEEFPVADQRLVEEQWSKILENSRFRKWNIFVTPRRLIVFSKSVSSSELGTEKVYRGPPENIAYDEQGNPTAAAIGFARSKGVNPDELFTREIDGGKYVYAYKPRPVVDELSDWVTVLINELRFPRTMRWNNSGFEFPRPIRWLVALWGDQVVPVEVAGVRAGRFSRGHRQEGSSVIEISSAEKYEITLRSQNIELDFAKRRANIEEKIEYIKKIKRWPVLAYRPYDEELLEEVARLVEMPAVMLGSFHQQFLELPEVVLKMVMKKHQRYFPLQKIFGKLQPYFLVVCDGFGSEKVLRDNEKVLAARFADAQFFYEQDRKQHLEDFLPRLGTLAFHEKLGSMRDKSKRLERLVTPLATLMGFTSTEKEIARQAARLCKADLATQMVIELTSLQGEMGRIYALEDGVSKEIAQAIYEHWLPRFAGDELPKSKPGILLALADRLDSLVGLFVVGEEVTATADPFGLRRAALGVIRMLVEYELDVSFSDLVAETIKIQIENREDVIENQKEVNERVQRFMRFRLYSLMAELEPLKRPTPGELITFIGEARIRGAVLAALWPNTDWPLRATRRAKCMIDWKNNTENWSQVIKGYLRCVQITKGFNLEIPVLPVLFRHPAETALYEAYQHAQKMINKDKTVKTLMSELGNMLPAINSFFDEVLVMSEDQDLRHNRLTLLAKIVALTDGIVELRLFSGFE